MLNPHAARLAWCAIFAAALPMNSAHSQPPRLAETSVSLPCVLLKNDNVLFGHAHQVGELVIVRTGKGGEVQLPRGKVACWADSTRDLYRYRVDHRQNGNLSTHLRDARWCLRYDLFDLAAKEIVTVRRIDPNNAEAEAIEAQLGRMMKPRKAPYATFTPSENNEVRPAGYAGPPHEKQTAPRQFDTLTLRAFASHVQPMLITRCGRCHNGSSPSDPAIQWTLVTPPAGARASARMTRENLAAAIAHIDPNDAEQSELFIKATTAHGGSDAPLDARSPKAIHSLRTWLTIAGRGLPNTPNNPTSPGNPAASTQQGTVDGQASTARSSWSQNGIFGQPEIATDPTDRSLLGAAQADSTMADSPQRPIQQPSATGVDQRVAAPAPFIAERPQLVAEPTWPEIGDQPARLPQVANPFDPDLFNRRFHMKTNGTK